MPRALPHRLYQIVDLSTVFLNQRVQVVISALLNQVILDPQDGAGAAVEGVLREREVAATYVLVSCEERLVQLIQAR